ncbi:hypothetical protein Q3G72_032944 [Acer saccharum]|nr:hypothetical protein Q3G72_032944 [Acer saccharum]
MTAFEFRRCLSIRLLTWGNFYAHKTIGPRGKIVSLDPLDPALMTVRRTLDGAVTYVYADPRGQVEYSENDVWHVKGFSEDGLIGLSPIAIGARSMIAASNLANAGSKLFGDDLKPTAVLTRQEIFTKDQRAQIKEAIKDGMITNTLGGPLRLIEGGMTYQQLAISPQDAQMIEQSNASVEDLCRWFGVPPAKIGHGTAVSNWGTGREQQNRPVRKCWTLTWS